MNADAEAGSGNTVIQGTIAFTDIVGFTELVAVQGDDVALAIVTRQEQIVSSELPADARIVKELGDGLLLFFPDCGEAVKTCLRLQDRFDDETERFELPLWVRIGLHWGKATRYRNDLIGHDVNIASRISDLAGPGEVLLSDAAAERATTILDPDHLEEVGPVVMKGIPEPVRIYRVVRPHVELGAGVVA